jgi:hypothetical protein
LCFQAKMFHFLWQFVSALADICLPFLSLSAISETPGTFCNKTKQRKLHLRNYIFCFSTEISDDSDYFLVTWDKNQIAHSNPGTMSPEFTFIMTCEFRNCLDVMCERI